MAAESSSDGIGGRFDASFTWVAAGLAVLHALLGLVLFEPTLFPGGDNAGYLILGDALRSGEGYRDLYLPGAPLHGKYPPFLPGMIAVLGGVQAAKFAMLVCTSLAVWVTARLGRCLLGAGPALLAAAVLAFNPTLLEYGHYILSEAPFVLLVLLSLWAFQRDDTLGVALAMAAAIAAFATRTAGLTILLALPIAWLVRKQVRPAAAGGAAALAALVAWGLYQGWAAPDQPGYLQELVLIDPYTPDLGSVGLSGLVVRAAGNLWAYASRVIPQTAVGAGGDAGVLTTGFGLVLAGLALAGWAVRARRTPGAPEIFALLYGGLMTIWPDVWTDRRFLLPLYPMLVLLAVGFLAQGWGRIPRWGPVVLSLALVLPSVRWVVERAPSRMACAAAYRTGYPCDSPAFASLYEAAHWARENTPTDAIIGNRKPRLFFWYSRRQGDLYPYSAGPAAVLSGLDRMGATYVVVDQISATTSRYLVPAIQAYPARFESAYRGGSPETFILRLRSPPTTAE